MAKMCNMCGKKFDDFDAQEEFGFHYYFGYGSKYDLEQIDADFCCKCFDKILDWIVPQVKIPIFTGEYKLANEVPIESVNLHEILESDDSKE